MQPIDSQDRQTIPTLWVNPEAGHPLRNPDDPRVDPRDIEQARDRMLRWAPHLAALFPELAAQGGRIESPLLRLDEGLADIDRSARLWVKADHALPVAGSIKARGGFHEVLEFAERIALEQGLIAATDDWPSLDLGAARNCFARYEVMVGSTGNLGMSIGILSAALGFKATVHMSAEARAWKKQRLRQFGVSVHEHDGDYGAAVAAGREQARQNPRCHFVDDEQSLSLFIGYAAAAWHLREQLAAAAVVVDARHPLFVYLPCGVGGAPGGLTYGLKQVFGSHVHCFFVEPEQSACFLARMQHPDRPDISIYDVGQDNRTIADGLAVPRASGLAYPLMRSRLAGIVTTSDRWLLSDLADLYGTYRLQVEPSAAAAVSGVRALLGSETGRAYLARMPTQPAGEQINHVLWTTGGLLVPADAFAAWLAAARECSRP